MSSDPVRHDNTIIFPASLDPDAVSVVRKLNDAGFESYLVGGCVRDLLCGMIPKDFDVSTAARPRQIRSRFRNCRVIGRRFKLAHVHFGTKIIEVATFRNTPQQGQEPEADRLDEDEAPSERDGEREEDDLLITRDNVYGTAEQDVLRRDFTINALLYDVRTDEVIDYVGGVEDLNNRMLRTIGEPATRLAEDPVRMLRALKFRSRIGLTLEPEFDAAMRACANLITRSAPPRVLEEIFKLMACGKAQTALPALVEYGLLEHLLPDISEYWRDHVDQLASYGAALDRVDGGRRRVSNGFLLSILMLEPWKNQMVDDEGDPMAMARDIITPAARHMSIPRRDVAIMKQLLVLQPRLTKNRKSRRVRMDDFLSRPITREAIDLLYVTALAGSVDPEAHALWARRIADLTPPPTEAGHASTGSGRRRRRGSRRRRRPESVGEDTRSEGGARSDDAAVRSRQTQSGPDSKARPRRPSRPRPAQPQTQTHAQTHSQGPATRPSPAVAEATASAASSAAPAQKRPGGLKGFLKRLFGQPEASAVESMPTPQPRPRAETSSADATEAQPDRASDRENPDGTRRRRRRGGRGGRGRRGGQRAQRDGSAASDTAGASDGSKAATGTAHDASTSKGDSGQGDAGNESKGRRRRSRRGGSRRGEGSSSTRSGSGSGNKRDGSSRRGKGRGRGGRTDSPDQSRAADKQEPKPSTSAAHERPEDIEDLFDW